MIEHLVFCGGGARGVAYCGALAALEHALPRLYESAWGGEDPHWCDALRSTSGASVGALVACALALRVTGPRLFHILLSRQVLQNLQPALDVRHLWTHLGLDNGEALRRDIRFVLEVGLRNFPTETFKAETLTLADLKRITGMEVAIAVTKVVAGPQATVRPEMLSAATAPHLAVVDALYMSMAVPLLYQPGEWGGCLHVDGGLLNNTPILPDMDPRRTLVFQFQPPSFHREQGLWGYLATLVYAPINLIEQSSVRDFRHIVVLDTGEISAFTFSASLALLMRVVTQAMLQTWMACAYWARSKEN